MSEGKAVYDVPQVTCYDVAAEFFARMRAKLPRITTGEAYREAVTLLEALAVEVEAWEERTEQ